jgi:maleate isomerase
MARLAGSASQWMKRPVVAINTAIYWNALRSSGIQDKIAGFGPLLEQH